MNYRIPFNRPGFLGPETGYIEDAIRRGCISGDGYYSKKCEAMIREAVGSRRVLLTTSCTHALEMSALLLDLKPGDEVVLPSFTFVSTVNAFVLRGARPVFADIRRDTLNIDEERLEPLLTERTKAVAVVHYAGVGCEMDRIMEIAGRRGVAVVEDNAHGLFGKFNGKYLGTFGSMATQSFHETKNFNCGEGGALLLNDQSLAQRAEIIREKGTNRSRFFRGEVDRYTWVDIGSSYCPSDLLAAYLCLQLENREKIQESRRKIWEYYMSSLRDWAAEHSVGLPVVPAHCDQSYHMFYLVMPDLASRQALISSLKEKGILAVFHYLPLHLSEMGAKFGGKQGDCPVTEDVSDRLLRLPFFNSMTEAEMTEVSDSVRAFRF
ncbi:MAG TPA: dTDP-4-amino-4,6-dideoxygalactose transaminase [Acidobacteriota bacterium]|nr:dTDP-4-amino-4,6-dideoxygalactose transaminase [Acidobacteriota bacterium]HNT17595.1 dTDP-4-amino-4,6-dideoxygalactose transaminase [Acidobacteriota bacterium]